MRGRLLTVCHNELSVAGWSMMVPLTTYTATCWREGTSWLVRVAQLDRVTRAARLTDVDAAARRLIGAITGTAPESVVVAVDLKTPEELRSVLDDAARARRNSNVVSVEAVAERRTLARRLAAHGYGSRDISALLEISPARARQLAGEPTVAVAAGTSRIAETSSFIGKPHSGYQHEAFMYRSDAEFVAGTVPFIQDGLALGQPTMVIVVKSRLQMIQAALGSTGGEVHYVDMAELAGNPARIIPAWRDFIQSNQGRPIRGIGEPRGRVGVPKKWWRASCTRRY